MATVAGGIPVERLQIGRVIERATGAIGRNALLMFGLAIGLTLLSNGINAVLVRSTLHSAQVGAISPLGVFQSPLYWLNLLWSFISGFLLYGVIVHATVVDLGGERPTLGGTLSVALRSLLPLIGLAIVSYFAVLLGFVLFVIPAFLLLVRWSVAVPALVEERAGVFGSLKRSNALTRGSRWRIFALFLIVFLVLAIPSAIAFSVIGLSGVAQLNQGLSVGLIALALAGAVSTVIGLAILGSCYVELRYVHDGIAPDRLAEVFA